MDFKDLSPELMERARACKTTEEIMALAKEAGYDLSDEQLDSLSGGKSWSETWDCLAEGFCTDACHGHGPIYP